MFDPRAGLPAVAERLRVIGQTVLEDQRNEPLMIRYEEPRGGSSPADRRRALGAAVLLPLSRRKILTPTSRAILGPRGGHDLSRAARRSSGPARTSRRLPSTGRCATRVDRQATGRMRRPVQRDASPRAWAGALRTPRPVARVNRPRGWEARPVRPLRAGACRRSRRAHATPNCRGTSGLRRGGSHPAFAADAGAPDFLPRRAEVP